MNQKRKWTAGPLGLLFNNFWLKIISVAFASVLFVVVRSEQVREFSIVGRVQIITAPQVAVVGAQERAVEIQVKIPNSLVNVPPSLEEVKGVLDMTEQKPGRIRVKLGRENFPGLEKNYSVTVLDPWIEVHLDEIIERRVPVKAILHGLPAAHHEVGKVLVTPKNVLVRGAKDELEGMSALSTSPINIDGISENFSSLTRLNLRDFSSLTVDEKTVHVQVVLTNQNLTRELRGLKVLVEGPEDRKIGVKPQVVDVVISCPKNSSLDGKESVVRALARISAQPDQPEEIPLTFEAPMGCRVIEARPSTVRLVSTESPSR